MALFLIWLKRHILYVTYGIVLGLLELDGTQVETDTGNAPIRKQEIVARCLKGLAFLYKSFLTSIARHRA